MFTACRFFRSVHYNNNDLKGDITMSEGITTAVTSLMGVVTTVISYVTDNAVLAVCFVAGTVVPAGIAIFRKLKRG
mgnify:CR=1 FL=1